MTAQSLSEREVVLDIEGMTCASCVDRLERVLARQPSVAEARVSLATRTAAVRYGAADPSPLVVAVEKAGYGARLREASPDGSPPSPRDEIRDYRRRLAVAAFCSFDVLVLSLIAAPGSHPSILAAWALATPVQFYAGWPFLRAAFRAARQRVYTMDTLIACGSLAAYGYSAGAAASGAHHVYFDTSAMIVTLILLGRVLETTARARAGDAARVLLERQPRVATLVDGPNERKVPAAELRVGDRVAVLPGQHVPADGIVRTGTSSVDLSMLTGESVPVDVEAGAEMFGGSLNRQGRLEVELTRVGAETRLAQIVRLLEVTQASKAPIQRLADRVAAVFVPRILALAAGVFAVLWVFGPGGLGGALLRAAAVLLVACPCSLGLATPVAIMAGSGRAAELGILFKGGEVFEAARRIDTVLIDKTGTLTEGSMSLREIVPVGAGSEQELLRLAAAVERGSEHPIGRCVVRAAEERQVDVPAGTDHRALPGAGIEARVGSRLVRVGRPEGLPGELAARSNALAAGGLTVFAVWSDGEPVGLLGAFDAVKPGAAEAVGRLRRWGLDVAVVSGDRRAAVEAAARDAGIDRAVAEVFPEGKVEEVRRLQAAGKHVAFVGDGVNDAPALAQADLGIALGTGTDVAMEAGDVLILGGDLRLVADSLQLARRTFAVIAQNLVWAFAYNVLMIPLAVAGKVSPTVAAAAMAGSSVTVVGNALRLLRYGAGRREEREAADAARPVPGPLPQTVAVVPRRLALAVPRAANAGFPPEGPQPRATPERAPAPESPGGSTDGKESFARQESRRILSALGRLLEKQWEA
ncbi:MAG: cadmium-translocating P-type ATPase [Actinomycetota bacterium]|nr:cadmium-translocating P-type ATPase [Actinomycetota bacterium]